MGAEKSSPEDRSQEIQAALVDALECMLAEFVGPNLEGWDEGSAVRKAIAALEKAQHEG